MAHLGITPAYAGNTYKNRGIKCGSKDHPRLRGEHVERYWKADGQEGSPPPTRGTHLKSSSDLLINRITPAYAGNTNVALDATMLKGDHPRLRGEHH